MFQYVSKMEEQIKAHPTTECILNSVSLIVTKKSLDFLLQSLLITTALTERKLQSIRQTLFVPNSHA